MKEKEKVEVGPASNEWAVKTRTEGVVARFGDQEAAVAEGIDRARARRPSHLVVKDRNGKVLMDRRYGEDVWPPQQAEYYFYELSEGSRSHEGTTPIEAAGGDERD
jgi:hypothetical protein